MHSASFIDFYQFFSKYASKSQAQKITLSQLVPRQVSAFVPLLKNPFMTDKRFFADSNILLYAFMSF
jgi:hypothetical protein